MEKLTELVFHKNETSDFSDFLFKNFRFHEEVQWFHVVYWPFGSEFRILHLRASTKDDLRVPNLDFKSRLKELDELSDSELHFLLGTYGRFEDPLTQNPKVDLAKLPDELRIIVSPTKGYLLFKEQAMEFYSSLTDSNSGMAFRWMENWNKKTRKAREKFLFKDSHGNEVNIYHFFPEEELGDFFMNSPTSAVYFLLNQLHEDYQDQTIVEGKFNAKFLGELFYEEETEKESIEGVASLIKTKNGLLRLKLIAEFPKRGIKETWEFGLNYPYKSYPWLDYIGLEIIELGDQYCRIQLNPFREVLGEDYFDDFYFNILIKSDLFLG